MSRLHLPPDFRVIPVIDVRGGIVVRAVGGRREEYQPLTSCVTGSTNPLAVANDLREFVGTDELYVADLDGIMAASPNHDLVKALAAQGFRMWVDAGVREEAGDELLLLDAGAFKVVAGSETVFAPITLAGMAFVCGADNIVFSLDLKNGEPLTSGSDWPTEPCDLIDWAWEFDIRRVLLLDLARVGMNAGTGTEGLCAWAKAKYPDLELIVGGGVRGPEDLPRLKAAGASAALVASAIHDGKFGLPESPQ